MNFYGADNRTWTDDLILTKDALYLLSYTSKFLGSLKREPYGDPKRARTVDL